jgi:hypothetical protein
MDARQAASTFGIMATFMFAPGDPLQGAVARELAILNATNATRFARFAADIAAWLVGETFAPQQVDLVPFPITAYESNAFYGVAATVREAGKSSVVN